MEIDGIKVCEPIEKLILFLRDKNIIVKECSISDYHFHEVLIIMSGEVRFNTNEVNIDKIINVSDFEFACECHWSTVKMM